MTTKWADMRTCFCGKKFKPGYYNQKFCCQKHARIYERATAGKYGTALIERDPQAALQYYWYVT
jgi:uncharacterized Zn finger protein